MDIIQDENEEKAVLGCILRFPELVDEAASSLRSEHFHDLRHRNLFDTLVSMSNEDIPIDVTSTRSEVIQRLGNIEKAGGIAYIADLWANAPSSAHLPYALGILDNKLRLREHYDAARTVIKLLGDPRDDGEKLEECGSTLSALLQKTKGGEPSISDIAMDALGQIQRAHEHEGECTGVATGFFSLDRNTTGLHGGEYIILAARPSMGKTSLAMNIAEYVTMETGKPVGVLSLEMNATSLMVRAFSSRAEIDGRNLRSGKLNKQQFVRLTKACHEYKNSNLHIDDSSGIGINEAAARIRRMVHKHKCELIVIDYIQLIHAKAEGRTQEVAKVSQALKGLAIQLNVPVIALSQLSRSNEQSSRSPRLSDLRDSGSLEQDADQVWFLYREDPESNLTQLNIAKNRNGPCGEIDLEFEPKYTRYINPKIDAPYLEDRPKHPDFELANVR